MGALKFKDLYSPNRAELDKKEIEDYKDKIFNLLQNEKKQKLAASIISEMLNDKKSAK